MKINDQLVLVEKANGTWHIRSMRKDYRNPSLMSPAKKVWYQNQRIAAAQTRGVSGLVIYKGRLMPKSSAMMGEMMEGQVNAEHIDYHVIRRQRLWDLLERSGSVLIQLCDRIVAVVQT